MIESSNQEELSQIVSLVLPTAREISLDQYGTRTLQALVERLHKFISEDGVMGEQLAKIVNELDQGDSPLLLCTDVHGNHVA